MRCRSMALASQVYFKITTNRCRRRGNVEGTDESRSVEIADVEEAGKLGVGRCSKDCPSNGL